MYKKKKKQQINIDRIYMCIFQYFIQNIYIHIC